MELASGVQPHGSGPPAEFVVDAEFTEEFKCRVVGLADEVVIALDGEANEIKMSSHTAGLRVAFEDSDIVSVMHRLIGSCQSHCSRAQYNHAHFCCYPCLLSSSGMAYASGFRLKRLFTGEEPNETTACVGDLMVSQSGSF